MFSLKSADSEQGGSMGRNHSNASNLLKNKKKLAAVSQIVCLAALVLLIIMGVAGLKSFGPPIQFILIFTIFLLSANIYDLIAALSKSILQNQEELNELRKKIEAIQTSE